MFVEAGEGRCGGCGVWERRWRGSIGAAEETAGSARSGRRRRGEVAAVIFVEAGERRSGGCGVWEKRWRRRRVAVGRRELGEEGVGGGRAGATSHVR
jgi:hypothetical protein